MPSRPSERIGRNDPCPCGSGKKYKRCCLQQKDATYDLWAQQHDASDRLTRDMMQFAARNFASSIDDAWCDFNMTDLPSPLDESGAESQIFLPYFLFHWDPRRPRSAKRANRRAGTVTRAYELEKMANLSETDRLLLEQATTQPVSFYDVLWCDPGERIGLRDVLIGTETEVIERTASRSVQKGDIVYGQIWNWESISILGCLAPICVPPRRKAAVIALRKKLQRKIKKQNRDLTAADLVRYADDIRLAYLDLRDSLNTPPRITNTDGDPLVFHTLTFQIESAEAAFEALAALAVGRSKQDLLDQAKFETTGALRTVTFEWLKKGNRKISSWDNTILGKITISNHSLVAEVNSEKRARRLQAEILRRLGSSATHQSTVTRTVDEALAKSAKPQTRRSKIAEETSDEILRDPDVRKRMQEELQKQVEMWVHEKIPILGGRTPTQAVGDPEGREIVESLLLQWERHTRENNDPRDIRPDVGALRWMLNLPSSAS
jgi:hypothetical protein